MSTLATSEIKKSLFTLLSETFESGKEPSGTMYLDRGTGLFDTLAELSAKQASQEIHGTTLAAHVHHSLFYLEVLERAIQGDFSKANWQESWQLASVDEERWQALKSNLYTTYQRIYKLLETQETWEDSLEAGFSMVIHSAYHLGAIRQLKNMTW